MEASLVLALALSFKTYLRQPCSWILPSATQTVLSWYALITAGVVVECCMLMVTACLPFCHPSSQEGRDYVLTLVFFSV